MRKDICPCPNCAPYAEPKVKKAKKPKVKKEYTHMSGLLAAIAVLEKSAMYTVRTLGFALVFTTIIGGLFFDLTASVVAAWFVLALGVTLLLHFLIALVIFFIYFLRRPGGWLVAAGAVITLFCWIFIAPPGVFIAGIGDTLTEIFSFVNNALF